MRAYRATVGETDGNIIAAIITTQTPRNQPSAPSAVPGPSSIPLIRSAVDHQATAPRANRRATSPSRARTAPNAAARPSRSFTADATPTALISGGPGEARLRERRFALVRDAELVDTPAGRPRPRQLVADGV